MNIEKAPLEREAPKSTAELAEATDSGHRQPSWELAREPTERKPFLLADQTGKRRSLVGYRVKSKAWQTQPVRPRLASHTLPTAEEGVLRLADDPGWPEVAGHCRQESHER